MTNITLADLKEGEKAYIRYYSSEDSTIYRFLELGLVIGEQLKLTRFAPLGDPIEIEVMNSRICIRKQTARQIFVEKY